MTTAEEYQAERDRLELNRSLDWSTFPQEYIVAGEVLQPMTVQVWFDLLALKSPMLFDQTPSITSIIDYIWRNSKKNTTQPILKTWRLYWIERRVVKSLLNTKESIQLISVLCDHLKYSLDEFPAGCGGETSKKTNTMSITSGASSMVDEIASRYSIDPEKILSMTLRKAFSLQRVIRLTTIPDYKVLEAESLRAIKSKYLQELNNGGQ